jgi:hypothetical protein
MLFEQGNILGYWLDEEILCADCATPADIKRCKSPIFMDADFITRSKDIRFVSQFVCARCKKKIG